MSTTRHSDAWSEYEIYPQLVAIEDAQEDVWKSEAFVRVRVTQARELGITWSAIADVLDVSKQAAQQRFG
jgi:hypothetical protein